MKNLLGGPHYTNLTQSITQSSVLLGDTKVTKSAEPLTIRFLFFVAKGLLGTLGLVKNPPGTSWLTKESSCRKLTQSYTKFTQGLYQCLYRAYTELKQSLHKAHAKLTQSSVLLGVPKVSNSD